MKLIGLGHYSRVGKDSFANFLKQAFRALDRDNKLVVGKLSFAYKLKQITHELYGWAGLREPEFYETPDGAELRRVALPIIGLSPVDIWIKFGTDAVRNQVYDRTWVDYLLKSACPEYDVAIITDVRFPNEADAIKQMGGMLIKVVRPGFGPISDVDKALDGYWGWDREVGQYGTMDNLQRWADIIAFDIYKQVTGK